MNVTTDGGYGCEKSSRRSAIIRTPNGTPIRVGSINGDASVSQTEEGGSIPTPTLHSTKIPEGLLIEIANRTNARTKKTVENWSDSDLQLARSALPLNFHSYPLDVLRSKISNLRKRGKLNRVNGHAPGKGSRRKPALPAIPDWYRQYLESDHWKTFAPKVIEFWDHRCCLCYSHQDEVTLNVHHRTYDRKWHEKMTDCVCLCRPCHELFEMNKPESRGLFK